MIVKEELDSIDIDDIDIDDIDIDDIDIDDIRNLESFLRIVFILEECRNLKVSVDGRKPTRNINK